MMIICILLIIYRYVTGKRHIPVFLSRIFRSDCLIFYGLVILLRIYNLLHSSLFALIQPYFFSSLQKRRGGKSLIFLGFLLSFLPSFPIPFAVQVVDFTSKYIQRCFYYYFYYYYILQPCRMVQGYTNKMKRVAETHSQPYCIMDFSWFKVAREFRWCGATQF